MYYVAGGTFLYFCYFHGNTASANGGSDVYVTNTNPFTTNTPFQSCYSTTVAGLNRCMNYSTPKDGWLTTVTSSFNQYVNDNHDDAVDSYGCGIDRFFPCKTTEWAEDHPLPGLTITVVDEGTYKDNLIFINDGGDTDGKCGTAGKPCSNLNTGLSHFFKRCEWENIVYSKRCNIGNTILTF
jgi:hypothetical protein